MVEWLRKSARLIAVASLAVCMTTAVIPGNVSSVYAAGETGKSTEEGVPGEVVTEEGVTEKSVPEGQFLDPPAKVQWKDGKQDSLLMSHTNAEEWYYLEFTDAEGNSFTYVYELKNGALKSEGDFYVLDVHGAIQNEESRVSRTIPTGAITLKIYAGKGSTDVVRKESLNTAKYAEVTITDYQSTKLTQTPKPTDVELSVDAETNQLVVSLDPVQVPYKGGEAAIEYQIFFQKGTLKYPLPRYCYANYRQPDQLVWDNVNNRIKIPITNYVRRWYLDDIDNPNLSIDLSVTVKARYLSQDENGDMYRASEESDQSNIITYKNSNPVTATFSSADLQRGTASFEITDDDTIKKIVDLNSEDGSEKKLNLKVTDALDSTKPNAFSNITDPIIAEQYSSFKPFEVDLMCGEKHISVTKSELKITIPIPAELQGTTIGILRYHDGQIAKVGSEVDPKNHTVTFYTDKFSEYAIAKVKSDESPDEGNTSAATSDQGTSGEGAAMSPAGPAAPQVTNITLTDLTADIARNYTSVSGGKTGKYTYIEVKPNLKPEGARANVSYRIADANGKVIWKDAINGGSIVAVDEDNSSQLTSLYAAGSTNAVKLSDDSLGLAVTMPGIYTITASSGNYKATATVTVNSNFKDIPAGAYYAEAASKAYSHGITEGISENAFGGDRYMTRGQFITWLYKEAVAKDPSAAVSDDDVQRVFSDVPAGKYYTKAVLWGVRNNITSGTSAETFSPDQPVTRAQAVTFLWKLAGKPEAQIKEGADVSKAVFRDLPENKTYRSAIEWAADRKITSGTSSSTFSPNQLCSRAQGICFLYKVF